MKFLSIQAQDFIEELMTRRWMMRRALFLSIQAQDFIEEEHPLPPRFDPEIPEHSSSGLH